jgi:CDP-diacylglycerol---glycerol-3-phosphate 3-phosphatidyltransferase
MVKTVTEAAKKPLTFTDFLRIRFKGLLDAIGGFLNRLGLQPNTMTILGLAGNTIAAFLLAYGHIQWGGFIILVMGPIDALDGTMARLRGQPSKFGAFVDSVTDRYSELVILAGLLAYYLIRQDWLACGLLYLAASGSVLVSYVKARAESLGFEAKIGILTRVERFFVVTISLLINQPIIALWVIAILANITAVQRIYVVRKQAFQSLTDTKTTKPK